MNIQNSFGLAFAGALDFWLDGDGLGLPAIGLWAKIVVGDVNINGHDQFGDAGKSCFRARRRRSAGEKTCSINDTGEQKYSKTDTVVGIGLSHGF